MLEPGGLWAAPTPGKNYRDTATTTLETITAAVAQGRPWREVVAEHYAHSHPWLHQIVSSPARDLFFRQHPPAAAARILDIGSGWGQIALPLAHRPDLQVTALEPTPERMAFIRAAASQEQVAGRMHFVQANFLDLNFAPSFDLISCIGVLEWVPQFRPGDPFQLQIEFLRKSRAALRPAGRLVIGIENRLGLKYLMGAPDDHIGAPQITVYDAELATRKWQAATGQELRCFTRSKTELARMLTQAGFEQATFFAALPDYKLPRHIIPLDNAKALDAFFLDGNFAPEHNGSNGQALDFQVELQSHYRSLADLGVSEAFAPSFFVVAA
jgi:2-polyprenyl-3-methyl-5-hydroxy-6-metoxy-1,4-benzoquinol methylase